MKVVLIVVTVVALLLGIGLVAVAVAAATARIWAVVQLRRWRDAGRPREILDQGCGHVASVEELVARDLARLAVHDPLALDDAARRTQAFDVDAWHHALAVERLAHARLHARRPGALARAAACTAMLVAVAAVVVVGALGHAANRYERPSLALVASGLALAAAALDHRHTLLRRPETLAALATFAAVPREVPNAERIFGRPHPSPPNSVTREVIALGIGHVRSPATELADLSWNIGPSTRSVDPVPSVATILPLAALALVEVGRALA